MDKYEYKVKFDQIKSLCADENYDAAAVVADSVNWSKIRNVNALVKAGEVYEKVERYEESREILLMAYDHSPIGRMILYRLVELAVKMGNFDEADEYYKEFVEIAPRDNLKYVLQYEIAKGRGASLQELIPILEQFKEQEYTEEWSYELAFLYHKAGMADKCVEACDELILWFGDGPFVERALELKMLYQPLSKVQEEKYKGLRLAKKGFTQIESEEMEKAGEYGHGTINIPQVTLPPERFNTVNLQEEIAKGIQQIIGATDKSTVTDTMENIKKLTQDIPYLNIPEVMEEDEERPHIETDEEIDGSLKINFQELIGMDSDGQMSMIVGDDPMIDRQITGQMTIADVLEEWEKTKRAAEVAMKEAEQRKLESAKARALQEAEDIMVRLNDVQNQMEAPDVVPDEIGIEEVASDEIAPVVVAPVVIEEEAVEEIPEVSLEETEVSDIADETVAESEEPPVTWDNMRELFTSSEPVVPEQIVLPSAPVDMDDILSQPTTRIPDVSSIRPIAKTVVPAPIIPAATEEEPVTDVQEATQEEVVEETVAEEPVIEDAAPEEVVPEETTIEEIAAQEVAVEEIAIEEPTIEESTIEEPFVEEEKLPEISIEEIEIPEDEVQEEVAAPETVQPEAEAPVVEEKKAKRRELKRLSSSQKEIFSYFVPVKGMEEQLCSSLNATIAHLEDDLTASRGNVIVQGGSGCGKTVLATSFIKAIQTSSGKLTGKVGKISGESLNHKDILDLLKKVSGGALIIERAGELNRETAVKLALLLSNDASGILVILEDTTKGIKKALSLDDAFASRFSTTLSVPSFTNDELVSFAKAYAEELGYDIEEMAILALYNRISNIQKVDQATTLTEVKEIVDDAITKESKGGIKKAFSILTARRYTDDDRIILREKDFE